MFMELKYALKIIREVAQKKKNLKWIETILSYSFILTDVLLLFGYSSKFYRIKYHSTNDQHDVPEFREFFVTMKYQEWNIILYNFIRQIFWFIFEMVQKSSVSSMKFQMISIWPYFIHSNNYQT